MNYNQNLPKSSITNLDMYFALQKGDILANL
jgi:hypothetical protein